MEKADDRSDDKGPEPEALALGEIDGRTYAFIGMERNNTIFAYDITLPSDPHMGRLYDAVISTQLARGARIHQQCRQPDRQAASGHRL